MILQYCIYRIEHSIECFYTAIGDISTRRCPLYSSFADKYSEPAPAYIMSTPVEVKSNVIAVLRIQDSIFHWKYLHCCWWYLHKSIRIVYHICCLIQRTSFGLRFANSGPVNYSVIAVLEVLPKIFNWTYLRFHCWYLDNSMLALLYIWCTAYSGFNIPLIVSTLLLAISRQFDAFSTPNLMSSTARISRFLPCVPWTLPNPLELQFCWFYLKSSIERISMCITDISTIQFNYAPHMLPNTVHISRFSLCHTFFYIEEGEILVRIPKDRRLRFT